MRSSRLAFALSLSLSAGAALAHADVAASARVLELKAGTVDTVTAPNLLNAKAPFAPGTEYVIQLDGPMTAERHAALTRAKVGISDYLPRFAYVARLDGLTPQAVRDLGFVVWVGEFRKEWKLDPELGKRIFSTLDRRLLSARGQARIVAQTFAGRGTDELRAHVAQVGGTIVSADPCGTHWFVEVTLPAALAPGLADLASVQFVEDAAEIQPRNDSNR